MMFRDRFNDFSLFEPYFNGCQSEMKELLLTKRIAIARIHVENFTGITVEIWITRPNHHPASSCSDCQLVNVAYCLVNFHFLRK